MINLSRNYSKALPVSEELQDPRLNEDIKTPLQLSKYYGSSSTSTFTGDIGLGDSKYDEGLLPGELSYGLDYIRASQQPGLEQAGRAIGGGLYKGLLTAAEDVGYLLDIENNAKRLIGLEDVNSNWLSDFAKEAKESFDENHPIYRYNPTKTIDLNDPGFWWSALQGMVDSAVGFGIVGAGAGATVGRGIKYLTTLGKFGVPLSNVMATAGTALTTNYAEGKMMSLELFTNTVDNRMKQFDDQQFKKAMQEAKMTNPFANTEDLYNNVEQLLSSEKYVRERNLAEQAVRTAAGKEADIFQARNMIFMLSDAVAINGMFKGTGYTRNILKDKSIKNAAIEIAKQAPTEYAEEVGQGMFQKEGEYQAMKQSGGDIGEISSDPVKRAWDFFTDPQTQLEGFMGLFGGPIQHVLVQAPMNLASGSDKEYRDRQSAQIKSNEQLLNGLISKSVNNGKAKERALINGNLEEFEAINNDEFTEAAYKNFSSGTTENLENLLKEVSELSKEEAKERGYDDNYQEQANKKLEELAELEKTYLKVTRKFNGEKDYLLHYKIFNLESKRNFITGVLGNLKNERENVLNNIRKEVETLEDITISSNQMKKKSLDLSIKAVAEAKAKLTATKNEALMKPNKKLEVAQQKYYNKVSELESLKSAKAPKNQIMKVAEEVDFLQKEFNRLSQFADDQTQNKATIDKVNKLYNGRIKALDDQLEQLKNDREKVKKDLKDNKEKIDAFNEEDYSKWEEAKTIQSKIDNFTSAKKLYDDIYKEYSTNKAEKIKETEEAINKETINEKQQDIDSKLSAEEKQQIIDEETNPTVKEALKKNNEKVIKDTQRKEREQANRNNEQFGINKQDAEELDVTDEINNANKNIINDDTIKGVEAEINKLTGEISKSNEDIQTNSKGDVVYLGKKSEKGYNLIAYLSRLYERIINGNTISKQDIDNELLEGQSKILHNPNKFQAGTKLTLKVISDPTIKINSTTGQTWGEFMGENGLVNANGEVISTDDSYINNVPIGIYEGDKLVGFLHNMDWINEENIYGDIVKSKESLYNIRKHIIDNRSFETTVKNKSIGYLFKNVNGLQKVSEAIQDPNLILGIGGLDEIFTDVNIDRANISNKNIIPGYTYMIVQTGKGSNGKTYTAIPLINGLLADSSKSKDIITSITSAIRIYYKLNKGIELTNEEKVVYETLGKEGFGIDKYTALTAFINQFIPVYYNAGNDLKDEIKNFKDPQDVVLFSIDKNNIQGIVTANTSFINIKNTTPEQLETSLSRIATKILPLLYTNTDKKALNRMDKPLKGIVVKDGKLSVETLYNSYKDYIKDNTKTDILSAKVDVDENGKDVYTYTIQPKIQLDFSKFEKEKEPIKDNKTEELNKQFSAQNKDIKYESIEEDDFGNPDFNPSEEDFLPGLEQSDIDQFREISPVVIVEGLDVTKQDAIVDVLFSEALDAIISNVNKEINVNEIFNSIFSTIQKALDTQNLNKTKLEKNITLATQNKDEEALSKFNNELSNVNQRIKLYTTYLNNKNDLINIAHNRLQADSIVSQIDNDEDGNIKEDPENTNEKIHDQSSYESDNSEKLSKDVKRFLSGIRVYNSDGTVKKNILNRDKLMNYEEVYRQLQVFTSGYAPDYNEIIAKFKEYSETFPFLKDVINKLNNDKLENIESIRNELTTLLTNHYSNSVMIIYRMEDGKVKTNVQYSNSNSVEESIREGWDDKLERSDLIEVEEDGALVISVAKADEMIAKHAEWKKEPPKSATPEVKKWLEDLGIVLDDKTWKHLEQGKFSYGKSNKKLSWNDQFKSGIFSILASQYLRKQKGKSIYTNEGIPTTQGIVKDLSRLDGTHTYNFHSNSHREGLKTVYSYGTNKYLTDLTRDIKRLNNYELPDGTKISTSPYLTKLRNVLFSSDSMWINNMLKLDENGKPIKHTNGEYIVDLDSPVFNNLNFFTVSLEALKKMGDISRDNRELNKLSDGEIEFTKLSLLTSSQEDMIGKNNRIIKLLYPTTSDKTTVMGINTVAVTIEYDFATGNIENETVDMLYKSLVLPEIKRIRYFEELKKSGKSINVEENYIKGASRFLGLSELNNPQYGLFLSDGSLNPDIHVNENLQKNIKDVIRTYINELVDKKINSWIDNGIVKDTKTNIYIDERFYNGFDKVSKDNTIKGIATDMVIQYLVGNMNIFQTYIGDPAMFYQPSPKNKNKTFTDITYDINADIRQTYINIGKRLASDIAPGLQGNNTVNNSYKQAFVNDRKLQSIVYDKLKELLGKDAEKYGKGKINSTDAQEYTTLKEKLFVMNSHGKIKLKGFYDKVATILDEEINEKKNYNYIKVLEKKLTKEEFEYLKNLTLQPEKPVYVQNIIDPELNIPRRLYIKSSAFALSPFLTSGTSLDKLRIAMERDGVARIAHNSAVKLGNVANPAIIWDEETGELVENIKFDTTNTLIIPRDGYKIQQEVPYDPLKEAINKVSQASKNLFINMDEVDGFIVDWFNDGKPVKGKVLKAEYMKLYKQMFELQQRQLFSELEYDPKTNVLNTKKLKDILKEEAIKRNYPLSDIQSLDLDEELKFLAYSPSASKFEALLNSIITNRVIKMKFPGKSYVLGSEAGFDLIAQEKIDYSKYDIVWTSKYNGKTLLAADGSGNADQVIMPWDFKEDINKYIDSKTKLLDTSKIPAKLLNRFGMRIPNQDPNSQGKIEVVGFFKGNVGDLIIAPKEYVIRMGSDFDVDKLYLYKYGYHTDSKGNIKESTITREEAGKLYDSRQDKDTDNLLRALFGEEAYDDAINSDRELFIDKLYKTTIWNKILDIHLAIHSNPDQRVQRQIHRPLGFWKLDEIAKELNEYNVAKNAGQLFTGLSDEYQKEKFMNAAAGKTLVGVFSNDSMFNALVQGKNLTLKSGFDDEPIKVVFGNKVSNGNISNIYTLSTITKLAKALKEANITENINEVNPYTYLSVDDVVYKSEVIKGFQSSAVDNEKEQILDKINANTNTSPIIKVLAMLGFEEEIPYFIAQDIIKDYVNEVRRLRGLGDFVSGVEAVAYQNVINKEKYKSDYDPELHKHFADKDLTISKMRDMLKGSPVEDYTLTQRAILDKYIDLLPKGRSISKLQSVLNVDSQGLGKTFFDTLIREEELEEVGKTIDNSDKVIDDSTIPGLALHYGLKLNNLLWSRFLPYEKIAFVKTFKELERLYNKSELSREGRVLFRTKMWNEIKKYRFSDPNLFAKTNITDPNYIINERKRLFINTKTNNSLAKIVDDAKKVIRDNAFLNSLNINIRKEGLPSIVKFRASSKEFSNESRLYEGITDLLLNPKNIGLKGAEYKTADKDNYTTRDLFQDLIWAAYLNGGIQEANQYVKYIPQAYLYLVPFAKNIKEWVNNVNINHKFEITKSENNYEASSVIKQIIQNNPEQLPKITEDDIIKKGDILLYNVETSAAYEYVSMYDETTPNGTKNFRIYTLGNLIDNNGTYYYQLVEIPTLGTSGKNKVSEYNYLNDGYNNSIYGTKKEKSSTKTTNITNSDKKTSATSNTKMKPAVDQTESNIEALWLSDSYKNPITGKKIAENVLNKISKNSTDAFHKNVASLLLSKLSNFDLSKLDITIKNEIIMDDGGKAAGRVTTTVGGKTQLAISKESAAKDLHFLEHVFLHEFIHVLTRDIISNPKTTTQKQIVNKLDNLREEMKKYFMTSDEHKDKYNKYVNSGKKELVDDNDLLYYSVTNTKEFVALMLGDKRLQSIANTIIINNKSLLQRFVDSIIDILRSLGFTDIKEGSATELALDSIIKMLEPNNEIKVIKTEEPKINRPTLFDDEGTLNPNAFELDKDDMRDLLPAYIPSTREIMEQFDEITKDGIVKKLAVSDANYEIMRKRAVRINQGQLYYKARIGEVAGENISTKSKMFYRIFLTPKEELKNIDYLADLVPSKLLDDIMNQCK